MERWDDAEPQRWDLFKIEIKDPIQAPRGVLFNIEERKGAVW